MRVVRREVAVFGLPGFREARMVLREEGEERAADQVEMWDWRAWMLKAA